MKYVILLFIVFLSSCQITGHNLKNKTLTRSVWVYSLESIENDDLIESIKNQGFNTAYVSMSPTYLASDHQKEYQNKVLDFLEMAENSNISIHALICEQPTYTLPKNHNKALEEIDNILSFINKNPHVKLDGIQLNIEPHALEEWGSSEDFTNGVKEGLLSDWLTLHKKISKKLRINNLQFSTVITWWYDSKFREGVLPSGDTSLLLPIVDFIVVMAFSPALDSYIQAEDECSLIPTIVGYNRDIYDSRDNLEAQKKLTDRFLSKKNNYLGDCVFHLDIY
jgi:hypothetical protein